MQPDANDIVYTSYGIDSILRALFEAFLGADFSFDGLIQLLLQIWTIYSIVAFLISLAFIVGIVYAYIRINQFDEIVVENLHEQERLWKEMNNGTVENDRWASVQTHLASENPNDWKLAIIEADVLLGRMLDKAGFAGNTIGEQLKSASTRSFATLDDAWQAHRVRNQIAHGGADFVLTQKIAKETLIQYERVFKEFEMI